MTAKIYDFKLEKERRLRTPVVTVRKSCRAAGYISLKRKFTPYRMPYSPLKIT